jgi:hypothetical protein
MELCEFTSDCDDCNDCTVDPPRSLGECSHPSVADGTACTDYSKGKPGACVAGHCFACEVDADCNDYKDCTVDTCFSTGLCDEPAEVQDGTPCAGGTCQNGECALQSPVLPCTEQGIRNAIAAGGGPYTFDCDGPTTVVTGAEIEIDNDVILDGEGKLTVDGNEDHPVFSVLAGITAELRGLTVGDRVMNLGTMTLTNSTVSAGGMGNSGGGTLTLINSTVSSNIANFANEAGGIHNVNGTLTLINSTVSNNTGQSGGGIVNDGVVTLVNSTVSNNTGFHAPGGGGILNWGAVTLVNSTVSENTSSEGVGGIFHDGGALTLINSTVSGNTSDKGVGGIANETTNLVTLINTLVDNDCEGNTVSGGYIESGGYNIESPGDTCGLTDPTDQVNVSAEDLKLGPLQDNGGPTMTHALLPGSLAIDVIAEEDCVDADGQPLTTDQRGEPRPETGGTLCDVGAYELQP